MKILSFSRKIEFSSSACTSCLFILFASVIRILLAIMYFISELGLFKGPVWRYFSIFSNIVYVFAPVASQK